MRKIIAEAAGLQGLGWLDWWTANWRWFPLGGVSLAPEGTVTSPTTTFGMRDGICKILLGCNSVFFS